MSLKISQEQIDYFKAVKQQKIPHYTSFYGMKFLFKDLLGFSVPSILDIHLEHGIIVDQAKPDQYLANTKAALIFVDNVVRKAMVPRKKNVFVLGSLFMRYRRRHKFTYNPRSTGTIVFPTHSSHHLNLEMDWKGYAQQLRNLPLDFHPVTVCMYWLDVIKGDHKYFEDVGLNVISNGHMFDENYASNFYSNLVKFKYASGNEPGSFLFYAVEMGMPFFLYGPDAKLINDGFDKTAPQSVKFMDIDYARKLKKVFTVDTSAHLTITSDQNDLVKLFSDDTSWINITTLRYLVIKNIIKVRLKKKLKGLIKKVKRVVKTGISNQSKGNSSNAALLEKFYKNGQIPWSAGYQIHKEQQIQKGLSPEVLKLFNENLIPEQYGFKLDERIVEYPWIFSRLSTDQNSKILDAGSTYNFDFIIDHARLKNKDLHIYTFFPEKEAFWQNRISYVYGDLRQLPYKDEWFDEVVCQSTLEHIAMDNSMYGYSNKGDKVVNTKSYDYLLAVRELERVLKPGGRLLLTFPFGRFENHGFFQQLDSEMLGRLLEIFGSEAGRFELIFFKYLPDGWIISDEAGCSDCQSYNPHTKKGDLGDGAAHSRSICCVVFDKKK